MKKVEVVIKKLLQVLLTRIKVNEITKETEYTLMGAMRINFNYYPPCPSPELTAAIGRHDDHSPPPRQDWRTVRTQRRR